MQPTSAPKTSPSETTPQQAIGFADRLTVAGNASFLCLLVAIIWTECFIVRGSLSAIFLFVLAAPFVATGGTVLITGISRFVIPRRVISTPLQFTIPLIWCLLCYLAILLISTQETSSMRVPEQLMPGLAWLRLTNLLPVCVLQVVFLWIFAFLERLKEKG